jgi:hypothetical protein
LKLSDDVEGAEVPPTGQRIGHEVRRPDYVRQAQHVERRARAWAGADARDDAGSNVWLVHAIDAFVVPLRMRTT